MDPSSFHEAAKSVSYELRRAPGSKRREDALYTPLTLGNVSVFLRAERFNSGFDMRLLQERCRASALRVAAEVAMREAVEKVSN